jgi:hypothetical protein
VQRFLSSRELILMLRFICPSLKAGRSRIYCNSTSAVRSSISCHIAALTNMSDSLQNDDDSADHLRTRAERPLFSRSGTINAASNPAARIGSEINLAIVCYTLSRWHERGKIGITFSRRTLSRQSARDKPSLCSDSPKARIV